MLFATDWTISCTLARNHLKCRLIRWKFFCQFIIQNRSPSLQMKSWRGACAFSLCRQPFLCHSFYTRPLVWPFPFVLFHSFPSNLSCGKDLQAEPPQCGTLVHLNPLMGSMGFAVLLEHWFKASSICQFNRPEAREPTTHKHTAVSSPHWCLLFRFDCCVTIIVNAAVK